MSSELQTQNYVSRYYGKRYSGNGRLFHEYILNQMFGYLRGGRILNVGCGTGFASDYRSDLNIYGIDISPEMIKKNNQKDKCVVGSAEELSHHYKKNSFNGIICQSLLHHLKDPVKALSEMHTVLKPTGRIAILETNQSIINRIPRKLMTYTKRFSRDHKNFEFSDLRYAVSTYFQVTRVKFIGFIAYPLIGFPDFIDLPINKGTAEWLIQLDEKMSSSIFRRMAFNVLILARKE